MKIIRYFACTMVLSAVVAAAPAVAKTVKPAAYIGTWGTSLAECKNALTAKDGPAVLNEMDYTQYQTHCTFGPLVYRRYQWHTKVMCETAGAKQEDNLSISVSGDALMLVWEKSQTTVDYSRCKNGAVN